MPDKIRKNFELILAAAVVVVTSVSAVAYKARDIDELKRSHHELSEQVRKDHDTLTGIANDVKWIRERLK
jgi:hypothetical protein